MKDLNSRQLREVIQCLRIGIRRAELDAQEQKAIDVRQMHLDSVKFRNELLELFERAGR